RRHPRHLLRLLRFCERDRRQKYSRQQSSEDCYLAVFHFFIFPFYFCLYLITLSARASTFGGIVTPICFAVFKLTTNSNFVGCSMGKSAGLVPFRILSTIDGRNSPPVSHS